MFDSTEYVWNYTFGVVRLTTSGQNNSGDHWRRMLGATRREQSYAADTGNDGWPWWSCQLLTGSGRSVGLSCRCTALDSTNCVNRHFWRVLLCVSYISVSDWRMHLRFVTGLHYNFRHWDGNRFVIHCHSVLQNISWVQLCVIRPCKAFYLVKLNFVKYIIIIIIINEFLVCLLHEEHMCITES